MNRAERPGNGRENSCGVGEKPDALSGLLSFGQMEEKIAAGWGKNAVDGIIVENTTTDAL